MLSIFRKKLLKRLLNDQVKCTYSAKTLQWNYSIQVNKMVEISQPLTSQNILPNAQSNYFPARRFKSKKSKAKPEMQEESDEEEEEEEGSLEDELLDKNSKILNVTLNNLRLDAVLKAGLSMARNKAEIAFYESRIRVNGLKVLKKSQQVKEGDEVDVIKGINVNNPNFLTVGRVEVLSVKPKGESFLVKLRKSKSLTIENYQDEWKGD